MVDWRPWCRGHSDLSVDRDVVEVRFAGDRRHRVSVESSDDGWLLRARIAPGAALNRLEQPELYIWQRNRTASLVGFHIEKSDRLVGEAWVPGDGATEDEFLLYLRTIAAESDRLEALLTGRDDE